MLRPIVLSTFAAFVAFLFFAIPAQADEIEPEPEPAAEPAPELEPEPEHEPEPEPEPVLAQDDDFARNGIYLGANMAGAWYTEVKDDVKQDLAAMDPPVSPGVEVENPLGLGARVGYRFHPHFAGEVEFQWFTKAKVELDDGNATTDALKLETLTLTGNVKGYLLTGRIQPFLLAGAGLMHFKADDKSGLGIKTKGDGFAGRFGAGIDFYLNANFVIAAEGGYVLPTGKPDGLDHVLWSAGLQYRF